MKMKILIAFILVCSVLMCACGEVYESVGRPTNGDNVTTTGDITTTTTADTDASSTGTTTSPNPITTDHNNKTTVPAPTTTTNKPTTSTTKPKTDGADVFYNDQNNFASPGELVIRPKHIYYENGYMVAHCFVINGLNAPVYNINVETLKFTNSNGVIAEAAFGYMKYNGTENMVSLNAYEYVVYTFRFAPDCIFQMNANFSSIGYYSAVEYSH